MTDIVVILASARSTGNTRKLIDEISHELSVDVIDLSEKNISPYDYEHTNINDDFMPVINEILHYKKIIFASPIYWYAASAQMKIFLDRVTDLLQLDALKVYGRKLREKTGYVVCTSASVEADSDFLRVFEKTFNYLGLDYHGYVHANCQNGYIPDKYSTDVAKFIRLVKC
ncbi:flavodoxin family protein [Colwellia sp. 20A7]|uniref:flavodoxin family protein n=1 Tax=Colwellia sp. 20A7 TaxID=2689569 RepID=UPI001357B80F|nr:flavodoxin family protein [Colwellia sp. 20A7]